MWPAALQDLQGSKPKKDNVHQIFTSLICDLIVFETTCLQIIYARYLADICSTYCESDLF